MSAVVGGLHAYPGWSEWRGRIQRLKTLAWQTALVGGAILSEMPFLDHLEELRNRIIKCLIALAAGTFICFTYSAQIIKLLSVPAAAAGLRLVAIDATEVFSLYFRVAIAGGICISAPFILWQTWRFIEPGLYPPERRYAGPFIVSTTVCFVLGATFAYLVIAPWFLQLEISMAVAAGIEITMSALSYFGLLTTTVLGIGVIFEMPPIVFILSRIGLVSAGLLLRHFKYAILVFALASAILTPSTQIPEMLAFMAIMAFVYLVSIGVAWIFGRKRQTF
jgi:sec-independent protein translocase protein TatC